jgi:Protein of unknown function (DUF938).
MRIPSTSTISFIFYTSLVRFPVIASTPHSHCHHHLAERSASFFFSSSSLPPRRTQTTTNTCSNTNTRNRVSSSRTATTVAKSSSLPTLLFQPPPPRIQNNIKRRKESCPTPALKMVTMDSPSAQRNKEPIWSVLETNVLPLLQRLVHGQNKRGHPLTVLEVAAGSGVHSTFFASKLEEEEERYLQQHQQDEEEEKENSFASVHWIATDPDLPSFKSLQERIREYQTCTGTGIDDTDSTTNDKDSPKKSTTCSSKCTTFQVLPMTLGKDGIIEDDAKHVIHNLQQSLNLILCINMIHISPWSATIGLFRVAKEQLCKGGILMTYGPYKENGTAVASNLAFDESLRARNVEWGVRDLERVQELGKENGMVLQKVVEMPANNKCLIFQKE